MIHETCCKECHSEEERLLIRKDISFCCCECEEENYHRSTEYYDQKWQEARRDFVRFLQEDKNNIRVFTGKLRELNDILDRMKDKRYTMYSQDAKGEYEKMKKEIEMLVLEKKMSLLSKLIQRVDLSKKICQGKIREIDDVMLLQAKASPINLLIGGKEESHGSSRSVFLCPFHGEKTASFTWYKRQNKWHCFGCGKGGDAIDLYMTLHNISFAKAVRELAEGRY